MGWKIISIFLLTMLKFIAGPVGGYAAGLHMILTIVLTVGAMMSSVLVFSYLGATLKRRFLDRIFTKRKKFTKRNRRFVVIWNKYGIRGVAFLTPLIFTPIGGTLLMASMGAPRRKIFLSMFLSALFWSIAFTALIYTFGEQIIPGFLAPADLHQEVFQSHQSEPVLKWTDQ